MLRFDLYQVSQLCARCAPDNTQLQLELQCGGLTLTSSVVLAEEGRATWHEMFPEHAPLLPPSRLAQVRGTRTNRNPFGPSCRALVGRGCSEHSPAAVRRAQCPDLFLNLNYTAPGSRTPSRLGYIRLNFAEVKASTTPRRRGIRCSATRFFRKSRPSRASSRRATAGPLAPTRQP